MKRPRRSKITSFSVQRRKLSLSGLTRRARVAAAVSRRAVIWLRDYRA